VNIGKETRIMKIDLSRFKGIVANATCSVLTGAADAKNTLEKPGNVVPVTSDLKVNRKFDYNAPALSLSVIRISGKKI
jgi:alpha-L-arabinofuranosidase